ncbi:hypothetical protein C8046_01385 [Serinibacter arcticus]|uniref:Zinc-ribbon 15 domain-containing protein n=1 Tax=Serinibacter arcticus TaxID=1655435 RepID=A0A2U1ZRE3_9MICO|nr:hypothetical protein C8046_01385 [Serinibacter arcticus]
MIIFGTYVIHRTLGEGHFMCPQCMGVTAYRVRRGRWFFHILFIPLIPMRKTPPHVECRTCRSKFALGVLGPDAEQYRDGAAPPPWSRSCSRCRRPVITFRRALPASRRCRRLPRALPGAPPPSTCSPSSAASPPRCCAARTPSPTPGSRPPSRWCAAAAWKTCGPSTSGTTSRTSTPPT